MLSMGVRKMSDKQRRIYAARIRLAWFSEARRCGSVSEFCRKNGVPRSTYNFWYKRWREEGRTLASLMDLPKTPHSHKKDPNEDTVSLVIQLKLGLGYGEDALSVILSRDYDVKISPHGVHNILARAGLLEKRKKKARKSRKLDHYPYKPGEVMQMDVKHWKHSAYQYDIIDCCTRIKFKMIFEDYNVNTTVKFLEAAIKFYEPAFDIQLIQTDNGSEFTNKKLRTDITKDPPLSLPERWCINHNIGIRTIPPSSPHLNGRIERPHGVDKWRYPRITTGSHTIEELTTFCEEDCLDYNTYRPHSMLNNMTPIEFLQSLEGYANACPNLAMICYNSTKTTR